MIQTTLRISKELLQKLKIKAIQLDMRSANQLIIEILQEWIEKN